jgi:hypothetical protein
MKYYVYLKNGAVFTVETVNQLDREFYFEYSSMLAENEQDKQKFSIRCDDISAIVSAPEENNCEY